MCHSISKKGIIADVVDMIYGINYFYCVRFLHEIISSRQYIKKKYWLFG